MIEFPLQLLVSVPDFVVYSGFFLSLTGVIDALSLPGVSGFDRFSDGRISPNCQIEWRCKQPC